MEDIEERRIRSKEVEGKKRGCVGGVSEIVWLVTDGWVTAVRQLHLHLTFTTEQAVTAT